MRVTKRDRVTTRVTYYVRVECTGTGEAVSAWWAVAILGGLTWWLEIGLGFSRHPEERPDPFRPLSYAVLTKDHFGLVDGHQLAYQNYARCSLVLLHHVRLPYTP